ncbi:discoidin domain-containing protein [Actinoplanes sp. NPDC049265]|uniref:discoidin domain-containing protein n=1 Tax=Actinoplanes sp. NPDC049265 TaxID=3363902 RepID=UPI00371403D3
MLKRVFLLVMAAVLVIAGAPAPASAAPALAAGRSAIYGGGPFYSGGQAVMDNLRSSGFTTVVLWAIHVRADTGDLWLNDIRIIANGQYVGDPAWASRLATLKQAPTSVNRIEVSVGSAGPNDWGAIKTLIERDGTGSGSVLYRNFQVLRTITGADAINDDDEQQYDLTTTTAFANMVIGQGFKFTFVPYTNMAFWRSLKTNLGAAVDRVYLQAYAGGAGNDPATWTQQLGLPVDPGLWSRHGGGCASGDSPATVESRMRGWVTSAGIRGGFMWLYDDMQACSAQGTPAQYAAAVNNGTSSGSVPLPSGTNVALNRTATGSAPCGSTETPAKAVNGSVSGGNADKFCTLAATRQLQIDLGSSRSLTGFVVRHAGAGGESAAWNTRDYDIKVSADGTTWTTVVQARGSTADVTSHINAATGRYVRLDIVTAEQSGNGAARIYEFEVYG